MNQATPATSARTAAGRSIVLIGLMGAGKSTIGQRLARRLGLPFVDADAEIERAAGCSIADIFEFHDEAAFRDGERRVIGRLLDGPPSVIATGGGAFMSEEIRHRIKERATSVWLRADLDTLVKRVRRADNRPLLRNKDPRAVLDKLKRERDPIYAEADIAIDSHDGAAEAVVERIVSALRIGAQP
jgi:shikimate kinase